MISYIWTACAAGWAVLTYLTGIPEALIVSVLCAGMAWFWHGVDLD